jgi:hypothetical protein
MNEEKKFLKAVGLALAGSGRRSVTSSGQSLPGAYWVGPNGRRCGVSCGVVSGCKDVFRVTLLHDTEAQSLRNHTEWTALPEELPALASKAIESAEHFTGLQRHLSGAVLRRTPSFIWEQATAKDEVDCSYYMTHSAARRLGLPLLEVANA